MKGKLLINDLVIQYQQIKNEILKNDIFNKIYKCYKNQFNYIAFKFHNEDLIQELSIALLKALDKYDKDRGTNFNNYFWKIAKNHIHIIAYYNHAIKRLPTIPLVYLDQPIQSHKSNECIYLYDIIEDQYITQFYKDLNFYLFLEQEIYKLLSPMNIAIIKLYLCGYTIIEIAHILHTDRNKIQSKFTAIRNNKKIRRKFNEYYKI